MHGMTVIQHLCRLSPYAAIRKEISEIEEGKYTTENNVLKVRRLSPYPHTLVPCEYWVLLILQM